MTRARPEDPFYVDRAGMANLALAFSVEMKALSEVPYEVCVTHNRRLLVFCDWP